MKHLHITLLLFLLMSMMSNETKATIIDGIDYKLYANTNEATVVSISNGYTSSVSIPSKVTYNGVEYCVTSIGNYAFQDCSRLISVTIPNTVTSISGSAFAGCSGLTSISIPNSVTFIGFDAFAGCRSLTNLTIPNSVTSIWHYAFSGCNNLISVKIEDGPETLTFGSSPFSGCPLEKLHLGRSINYSGSISPFGEMENLTTLTIGNSVSSIDPSTFSGCSGLTSVTIPNNVTCMGENAFEDCSNLTSVTLNSNHVISENDGVSMRQIFGNQVKSYIIGDAVKAIGSSVFSGCTSMTSVTLSNSITSIGNNAFQNCSNLTSITLPSGITNINSYVFSGCNQLASATMPDNITLIGESAFPSNTKLYVKKGSKTLLTIWGAKIYYGSRTYKPYDKSTDQEILPPTISVVSTTQTTASAMIENWCDGYTYECNGDVVKKAELNYTKLKPASTQNLKLVVSKDDVHYDVNGSFTTKGLSPQIDTWTSTASSISATGSYTEEDAKVVDSNIQIAGFEVVNGNHCSASGLNPGRSYTVNYKIVVDYGGTETASYTGTKYIYTQVLLFKTAQPKVVSEGNVVVSASTNLDEDEENVGFEWRCVDWTSEFPSNTGTAYLYEGTIEGNIKNLNTSKLWKFRPYYLSDSGTYHYGDWMGIDPTNTSFFEPTVRTYAKINITGNTALVKGYALSGTDEVVVKGFKYWRTGSGIHRASTRAASLPSDAITVEANGQQVISANLTGLEYNTTYHYVAFATTSTGETYYGEEQMFTTPLESTKYATFYDSQSAYILPKGLSASVVTGVNNKQLVYKVIVEGDKSNNVIPKGVAVMLTSAKDSPSSYKLTPTEGGAVYTGENLLRGSDVATTTSGSNCWYYKLSYGASGTDLSHVFGWYWGAANGAAFQIDGHKAWLAMPKSTSASTRSFSMEGEATDIVEMEMPREETEVYYDMQGRPIEKPASKGVYIYQGRKIIIK